MPGTAGPLPHHSESGEHTNACPESEGCPTDRVPGDGRSPRPAHGARGARRTASRPIPTARTSTSTGDGAHRPARWTSVANRLAHALAGLGVGKGDRVATLLENPPEQVVSLLRRPQARRDPGADQHRLQGRVPPPPARRLRREGRRRPGRLRRRGVAEVVGAETTPELDARASSSARPTRSIDARPGARLGRRCSRRGSDEPIADARRAARPTSRASSTPRARPGPSKGCMLPHNYIVAPRRADRPGVAAPARRRRAHAAAAVPLQRDLGVRRRHAARRRAARRSSGGSR